MACPKNDFYCIGIFFSLIFFPNKGSPRNEFCSSKEADILNLSVLGSGSSGNSTYVESDQGAVLVDAGFSYKQIDERMRKIGRNISDIDAVIITHEHIDHCRGLGVMSRRLNMPIYMNKDTFHALPKVISKIENINFFNTGASFDFCGMSVDTFSIPHDAACPVGISIKDKNTKVSIVTDLGYVTHLVHERIKDSDLLIIESNHDKEMLITGPYPWPLKQRIKGKSGHLSNEECGNLLKNLISNNLKNVVLAHLSEKNNHPDIARLAAQQILNNTGINLRIACQDNPSGIIAHA